MGEEFQRALPDPPMPALPPTQGNVPTRRGDGRGDCKRLLNNFLKLNLKHRMLATTYTFNYVQDYYEMIVEKKRQEDCPAFAAYP